jgi:hypothetical protein
MFGRGEVRRSAFSAIGALRNQRELRPTFDARDRADFPQRLALSRKRALRLSVERKQSPLHRM